MIYRIFTISILLTAFVSQTFTQTRRSSSVVKINGKRNLSPIRQKQTKEQKKILSPNLADLDKYGQFLSHSRAGIFRLLPDLGCDEDANIIKADKKCLETIPESSFYSFREREHTAEYLSDIRLKDDVLISDGILSQGFFVVLGDVALENVSLATEGLKFMQNYAPQMTGTEAGKQYSQMASGISSEGFFYRKAFPATENTTYALRVIAYRGSIYRTFRGYRYNILDGDKRIDMTIAFRIIRKEADGGITILWKELNRRDAPKISLPKRKNAERKS